MDLVDQLAVSLAASGLDRSRIAKAAFDIADDLRRERRARSLASTMPGSAAATAAGCCCPDEYMRQGRGRYLVALSTECEVHQWFFENCKPVKPNSSVFGPVMIGLPELDETLNRG